MAIKQAESQERLPWNALLGQVTNLAGAVGEIRAHQQMAATRISALETAVSAIRACPKPPGRKSGPTDSLSHLSRVAETVLAVYKAAKLVPWGLLAMGGAAAWKWARPYLMGLF